MKQASAFEAGARAVRSGAAAGTVPDRLERVIGIAAKAAS
jgi:hypothetical protein